MTDLTVHTPEHGSRNTHQGDAATRRLKRRYASERRFRFLGLVAVWFALSALGALMGSILYQGHSAFQQSYIDLHIPIPEGAFPAKPADGELDSYIAAGDYNGIVRTHLRELFPEVTKRRGKRQLYALVSSDASFRLHRMVRDDPNIIGTTQRLRVPLSDDADMYFKGFISADVPETQRRLSDNQITWLDQLTENGQIERRFNKEFFMNSDSREPELAGIRGAVMGSIYTLLVTFILAFPLGIATAIYLEEFAPRNNWSRFIEININNLAAVPSIVFGLLGLAIFLNFFGVPRSTPLAGGLVLALMTLPTIIIASRAAITSVPPSIRQAALGVGASHLQAVSHHVLPLAMPGILTGSIIGMARALGETAPLLMVGMVAFIADVPGGLTDPATVLPVQVFLWVDSPERAFVERVGAAIMVLLGFLLVMNGVAIYLRQKFEQRW